MNRCLQEALVPKLMTKVLMTTYPKKTAPNNYRPITCLPMMLKIITAQIKEEAYFSLTSHELFPEEQKGCHKGSRDTGELFYIDQHILNESKIRYKNLAMAWIDSKNINDIVPQSWIIDSLKTYKISNEVINFIEKIIKNLESGNDSRREKLS